MPWILIRGGLRKARREAKLDRKIAAKKTGLSAWSITRHESAKHAPRTMQVETVKRYAAAYGCPAELFAKWDDHAEGEDEVDASPQAPSQGTLGRNAETERAMGGPRTIELPSGPIEVLGPARLKEIETACAIYKDQRFAITGRIIDHTYIPDIAGRALGAQTGEGGRFCLARSVGKKTPFWATTWSRQIEHTRMLLAAASGGTRPTVIARVIVKPPDGYWKGFLCYEGKTLDGKSKRTVPKPFAFVIEDVIAQAITSA